MISEAIKLVMVKRGINGKDLATRLNCSSQNVYALLKKNDMKISQAKKIAEAMNCSLEIKFVMNDTKEEF